MPKGQLEQARAIAANEAARSANRPDGIITAGKLSAALVANDIVDWKAAEPYLQKAKSGDKLSGMVANLLYQFGRKSGAEVPAQFESFFQETLFNPIKTKSTGPNARRLDTQERSASISWTIDLIKTVCPDLSIYSNEYSDGRGVLRIVAEEFGMTYANIKRIYDERRK